MREKTTARILKEHRIRRFGAAQVLSELREPALAVAPGTIEAAMARIHGPIERIRLINVQLADAARQLDRLCKLLSEPVAEQDGETAPWQKNEQRAAAILDSLPGVARTVLATLLAEATDTLQRREPRTRDPHWPAHLDRQPHQGNLDAVWRSQLGGPWHLHPPRSGWPHFAVLAFAAQLA